MPENNSTIYDPVAAALSGQAMPSPPVAESPVQQMLQLPQQDIEEEPFSYDGYQACLAFPFGIFLHLCRYVPGQGLQEDLVCMGSL